MPFVAGTQFGVFEINGLIGVGGMGEVYRARDTTLNREVALKTLPDSFAADSDRIARFEREAKTLASLNHANIAQIYGIERREGTTALVMELVEGVTLAHRLMQGPIPADEALNIAMQIADALEAAHALGIVHRDLKPANIKLRPDGTVKVLDFGIAKAFDTRAISGPQPAVLTTPAMTQAGLVLGTAAYMSPEQARGKHVDQRADIWAFGCVLYEMLSGQSAFGGEDVTVTLARVLERDADMKSLPAATSPAVRQTLQSCLQKDLKKRVADIRDVRLVLAGAFESESRGAHGPAAARPAWIGAAGLVGALLAAALVWTFTRPAPLPPPPVSRYLVTPPATAPLANIGGLDLAISPDGRHLAFLARDVQNRDRVALYLRDFDGLDVRVVPGTISTQRGEDLNPFFSADGKWIGFRSPGRGIMRVAVSGGQPLKMIDDPGSFIGAAWAADDSLIFSTGTSLNRVSVGGGGTPERLTPESDADAVFYVAPTLLPGERAVLFNRRDGGAQRVAVLDLETGEQRILSEGGKNPVYAASGHVVFVRGTTLMAVPFDLDRLRVTGEPVALLQDVRSPGAGAGAADYALSASGTLVYVPGATATTGALVWVDRTGRVIEQAVSEPVAAPRDPRLSPDGRRLVVTTGGGGGDLWIYDLTGRPPVLLADEGDNRLAAWSPDGTQVAFLSSLAGSYDLYTAPADGSVLAPAPLRPDGLDAAPGVWSAEGELILDGGVTTGSGDIYTARVEAGSELRDLVVTRAAEFDASLSPNRRWLAYTSDRTARREIWVKRYPDGVPVRISPDGGYEPVWSRDGQELFYLQGQAMMAVAVETEAEFSFDAAVELFSGAYFGAEDRLTRSYDVAPDGRFLMIQEPGSSSGEAGSASIVVVENWLEELKRLVPTE
jgi:eukaryotic-like serine/threonine-protein kinase